VRRAAQILRYYGNEGDRRAGEIFTSPRAGEQILVTRKPVASSASSRRSTFPSRSRLEARARAEYSLQNRVEAANTVPLLAISAQALSDAGLRRPLNLLIGGSDIGDAIVERDIDAITLPAPRNRAPDAATRPRGVPAGRDGRQERRSRLDDADLERAR
jgi:aldehyde dehydrogenase (NAD+)